jgi:hypothetical protein
MLDYATWMKHKSECENDEQVSFQRMSGSAQAAIKDAHAAGAVLEGLWISGDWKTVDGPDWHPGGIYRVAPSWPGPAKLEPAAEYEDKNVFLADEFYRFIHPLEQATRWLLPSAPGSLGFVGYVYATDGREWCSPALISDKQDDGTYRLRVPKAVRFLKGATA